VLSKHNCYTRARVVVNSQNLIKALCVASVLYGTLQAVTIPGAGGPIANLHQEFKKIRADFVNRLNQAYEQEVEGEYEPVVPGGIGAAAHAVFGQEKPEERQLRLALEALNRELEQQKQGISAQAVAAQAKMDIQIGVMPGAFGARELKKKEGQKLVAVGKEGPVVWKEGPEQKVPCAAPAQAIAAQETLSVADAAITQTGKEQAEEKDFAVPHKDLIAQWGIPELMAAFFEAMDDATEKRMLDGMNQAEKDVKAMLADNPKKFGDFRELQRKGISWPHSYAMRKIFEADGFTFMPIMIKRDRMVCEKACKADVSSFIADCHDPSKSDIPNYYHFVGCEYGPTPTTDQRVSIEQKLKYLALNNLFNLAWDGAAKEVVARREEKYKIWKNFNSALGQLYGWELVEQYIKTGRFAASEQIPMR
jgi:hypothetical protein